MRRAMLLITGIGAGGLVLLALCIHAAAVYPPVRQPEKPALPAAVDGTFLQVRELVCYEGPFWEDGSDREVVDVAAVVVENTGGCYVSEGAVVLDWGEDRYVFALSWLPPGEKILLLEKMAKPFAPLESFRCYGWAGKCYPERTGAVAAAPAEETVLCVYNRSPDTVQAATVYYKHYDEESGMYIGGITYSETLQSLPPGGFQLLSPYRYVQGYSRVVCVLENTAP